MNNQAVFFDSCKDILQSTISYRKSGRALPPTAIGIKKYFTVSSGIVQSCDEVQHIRRHNSWLCCSRGGAQAAFKIMWPEGPKLVLCSRTSLQYCYLLSFHWGGWGLRLTQVKNSRNEPAAPPPPGSLHLGVTCRSGRGSRGCLTTSLWTNLPLVHLPIWLLFFPQLGRQNAVNPHGHAPFSPKSSFTSFQNVQVCILSSACYHVCNLMQ